MGAYALPLAYAPGAATTPPPNPVEPIYNAHHAMVYRTAYRVTGNASDAEDVLQTVFLRLMKREGAVSQMEQPEGYLRRSAVNAAIDLLRERQKTGEARLEAMPSSDTCTELRDLRDSLRRALAKLDPRPAEMVAMRFFEGYSNKEIAQMMGISQISVAVILHRAKQRLQKELIALEGGRK